MMLDEEWLIARTVLCQMMCLSHPLENEMYVGDMHDSGAGLGQALLACFFLYPALLNVGAAIMRTQFYMMVVCFPRDQ